MVDSDFSWKAGKMAIIVQDSEDSEFYEVLVNTFVEGNLIKLSMQKEMYFFDSQKASKWP